MKEHYFKRVQRLTPTKFWINNVTKEEAHLSILEGAVGCTQNPAFTWKMMNDPELKLHIIDLIKIYKQQGLGSNDILIHIQRDLVSDIANIFYPIYANSNHKMGYVSIQGDPFHEDCETIVSHAIFNCEKGNNIMAKIPVTQEGLKAIRILAAKGFPINATEVMSIRQAMDVCEVYREATNDLQGEEKAPIYFSHITGIFDEYLMKQVKAQNIDIEQDYLWQAGLIAAKKAYHVCKQLNSEVGFIGGGARGLHHFTEMVGADASITINWKNTADVLLKQDPVVIDQFHRPTPEIVIDELCRKLPDFVKGYFIDAIQPEEYEEYGPVVLFRKSFEDAWLQALDFIERQ